MSPDFLHLRDPIVLLFLVLAVGFLIYQAIRIARRHRRSKLPNIQTALNSASDSPLALPFEQALQPSIFLTQLKTSAENQTRRELGSIGNDAFKSALAGAKFALDNNALHVVFEGGIPKGAKFMLDKAGKALPTLVVDGSKILKNSRVVSPALKVASVTASAALVIFEVAHMISGYDNAQKLKKVECGVDALLHAHQSELKSRLEAIYRHCKELIHGDLNQVSEVDQRELHRHCLVLMELRSSWRADFQYRLSQIKTAEAGLLNKILWWREKDALARDRAKKATAAINTLEIIQLMHFSLMLQMCLVGASGRMDSFRKVTLRDECDSWSALIQFTTERSKEICGIHYSDAVEFMPLLDAMSDLVEIWSLDCGEVKRLGESD